MKKQYLLLLSVIVLIIVGVILYYQFFMPVAEEKWYLELAVNGKTVKKYGLSELKGKAITITVTKSKYGQTQEIKIKAVPVKQLLLENNIDLSKITKIKCTASDGYSKELDASVLDELYVWVVDEKDVADNGPLRIVHPKLSSKYWVKFLVQIDVSTG